MNQKYTITHILYNIKQRNLSIDDVINFMKKYDYKYCDFDTANKLRNSLLNLKLDFPFLSAYGIAIELQIKEVKE